MVTAITNRCENTFFNYFKASVTYKKGNCMGCHKWHGDGGPGYGGAAR